MLAISKISFMGAQVVFLFCVAQLINAATETIISQNLEKIASENGLSNCTFNTRDQDRFKKGAGFLSTLTRASMDCFNGNETESLHFIIKSLPVEETLAKFDHKLDVFNREFVFYTEILPLFQKIANEHDVVIDDIPKLYGSYKSSVDQVLFLEDLNYKDYSIRDTKFNDYQHLSLTLQRLGKFHAYSFAIRDQLPEEFEKIRALKPTGFFENGTSVFPYRARRKEIFVRMARKAMTDEDEIYRQKLDSFLENLLNTSALIYNRSLAEPYGVLIHGDPHANNILFKYNKTSGLPESTYLLDFQISRYGSPVLDVLYLLTLTTTQELRDKYYEDLIRQYYDSLALNLKQLGSDPEKLFPFEALTKQIEFYGRYAGIMAIVRTHFLVLDNKVSVLGDDLKDIDKKFDENPTYAKLLKDVIKDCIRRHYIF